MTECQCLQQSTLDSLAVPAFILSPDSFGTPRYSMANRAFFACSGLSHDDLIGKSAREVFKRPVGQEAFERHARVMQTAESLCFEEFLGRIGAQRRFRTSLVPVASDGEAAAFIVGTCVDVSIEGAHRTPPAEPDIKMSQLEQFVALAAHDLRAPMRNIQTLADMLRDTLDPLDTNRLHLVDLLDEVAAKSGGMIRDVLEHTQNAHLRCEMSAFDFGLMCRNICHILDPIAQHHVTWTDALVESDRLAVQLCLRNLLENAMKHGGKPSLNIHVSLVADALGDLRISVQDDGQGFENPVFDFLQDAAISPDGGYGLLAIRRLLTARGGTISLATPQQGQGSIVEFTLPGRTMHVQNGKPRSRMPPIRPESRRDAIGMAQKD